MFNLTIDNADARPKRTNLDENSTFYGILSQFGTQINWDHNKKRFSGKHVSLLDAAYSITQSGVSPTDYIIVWHKNHADISAIRHLLEKAGFDDIMPPEDHIIRLNYLFRHNLHFPRGTFCGLEFLFSIFFPAHPLRYDHHDALIDSKKAAYMTRLAEQLCNKDTKAGFRA